MTRWALRIEFVENDFLQDRESLGVVANWGSRSKMRNTCDDSPLSVFKLTWRDDAIPVSANVVVIMESTSRCRVEPDVVSWAVKVGTLTLEEQWQERQAGRTLVIQPSRTK